MLQLRTTSPAGTQLVAAAIASVVRSGDLVVLAGEMGAGKTVFAQGFGVALGVTDAITSPTYNLVHSHPAGRLTFHHADLYRLSTQHEVADLALAELAESDGVLLVEWGDVVASSLGEHLVVRIDLPHPGAAGDDAADDATADDAIDDEGVREITVQGVGRSWAMRWERLIEAVTPWTVPPC